MGKPVILAWSKADHIFTTFRDHCYLKINILQMNIPLIGAAVQRVWSRASAQTSNSSAQLCLIPAIVTPVFRLDYRSSIDTETREIPRGHIA